MSDLPIEEKKEVLLTIEERLARAEKDIQEIARGVNVQGALLEGIVNSFDAVIKTYLTLIGKYVAPKVADKPNERS